MDKHLLEAKLNQLSYILSETEEWLNLPRDNFGQDKMLVRACQRNLQLLVEFASDINGLLILDLGKKAAGSYRESFSAVFDLEIASGFSGLDKTALLESVKWRDDLIHEYEPEADDKTFYSKLKEFSAAYKNYARIIHDNFS